MRRRRPASGTCTSSTPSESKLLGASWGSTGVDVAVGAGGTIVERVREETSTDGGETSHTTTTGSTELTTSHGGPAVRGTYEEGEWVFEAL